jgi:hypothetical protein
MGPAFSEKLLLETGHAYQQVTNHHLRKPEIIDKSGLKVNLTTKDN